MIQWLTRLVNTDTPSDHKQPLDQLANWFAGQFRRCGAQTEIIKNREAGNHLLARWTCPGSRRKPVLILGHLDTVWGLAESQRRPARIENGKLLGPGAVDMRGGLTLVLALAKYLGAHSSTLERPVTVLLDSDEEVGSLTSRTLIEAEALKSEAVLVMEPCLPAEALKTFRKGVGSFRHRPRSCGCHAGDDFQRDPARFVSWHIKCGFVQVERSGQRDNGECGCDSWRLTLRTSSLIRRRWKSTFESFL